MFAARGAGRREMGLGILAVFLSLLSHVKTEGPRDYLNH